MGSPWRSYTARPNFRREHLNPTPRHLFLTRRATHVINACRQYPSHLTQKAHSKPWKRSTKGVSQEATVARARQLHHQSAPKLHVAWLPVPQTHSRKDKSSQTFQATRGNPAIFYQNGPTCCVRPQRCSVLIHFLLRRDVSAALYTQLGAKLPPLDASHACARPPD